MSFLQYFIIHSRPSAEEQDSGRVFPKAGVLFRSKGRTALPKDGPGPGKKTETDRWGQSPFFREGILSDYWVFPRDCVTELLWM